VKLADAPFASEGLVAVMLPEPPTAGVVDVHPAGAVNETNVEPGTRVSPTLTFCASDGPLFVAAIVYVRFVPAVTGSGESDLVTARSAAAATVVVAVAVLLAAFGSVVADPTAAEFAIVLPFATEGLTRTTKVKVAEAPFAKEPVVAVTFPVPPTAGVVAVQPAGALSETNVVFAGTESLSDTLAALDGPALEAVIV
jgi:hypothetical protein